VTSVVEWSAAIVAIAAAVSALGLLSRRLWRFVRLSVHAFETIQRELTPNGGGSTHDLVRKLAARTDGLEEHVDQVHSAAQEAARIARETAQLAAEQHGQNVARLDWLEQERAAAAVREQTYLSSLHEIGLDLEPGRPRRLPRPDRLP
jgi:hypothetical protein